MAVAAVYVASRAAVVAVAEPIYRQLDKGQYQSRGDDRTWFENGRAYRITELVPRLDGGANFQAVEVKTDAPAPVRANTPSAPENASLVELELKPEVPAPPPYVDPPLPEPPEFPPLPQQPLKEWARTRGWTGHGPIPKLLKAEYAEKYGGPSSVASAQ